MVRSGDAPERQLLPESLRATRRAVAFALRSENGVPGDPPDLSAVDGAEFLRAIRRHRVGIILAPHTASLGLDDPTREALAADSTRQRLAAMKLAAETIEVTTALRDAGIAVLVLKGVALAAQTTDDFTARGAGDVDIWVSPDDVAGTVHTLGSLGFVQPPGTCPPPSPGWQWRYVRWSYCELPLVRGTTYVDLHWSANGPGSVTPTFADVWERRTTASIGGQQLATLGIDDAAAHSCAHAYVDQWRWLRALVDIARLSALTDRGSSPQLAPSLAVSLSADVVRACFGPSSCDWPTSPPILRQRAVASSWHRQRQLDVDRAVSNRWRRSLYWAWHQDRLTAATGLADFTRTIAATALPPSSLVQAGTLVPAAAPSAVAGRALALAATRGAASPSEQTDSQVVRSNSRMSTRTRWLSRSRTGEALLLVSTARVLRATLPMASWQKLVGRKSAADSATPAVAVSPQGLERTVSLAVRRADERAPFHTTCLDQALAARWMLRRRGEHPVLVIGLNRADLSADPHAWLTGEHGGTVTGAAAMPDFVPVTEFR